MDLQEKINKKIKTLLSFVIIISVISCSDKRFEGGERASDSPQLVIDKNDSIPLNQETCINITNLNKEFRIESAYIDCPNDSREMDEQNKKILGCDKKLYIENDTIMICFKPKKNKVYSHKVSILLSRQGEFSIYDTSFFVVCR
jgi:hypothetical protein